MRTLFCGFSLLWMSHTAYAGVIYGVDHIQHQYKQAHYPVFVQMGSFSTLTHAQQFQQQVRQHTHMPVVIRSTKHRHRVLIGPFSSQTSLQTFSYNKQPASIAVKQHPTTHPIAPSPAVHPHPTSPAISTPPIVLNKKSTTIRAPIIYKHHPAPTFKIQPGSHPELSVFLGGSYIPNSIKGQTLQLLPYEIGPYADTFTHQHGGGSFTWGLDAKYRFKLHEPSVQNPFFNTIGAGIDFFQITNANQSGHVLQFNLPEFENYTYNLGLSNVRIMANVDLDFRPIKYQVVPFIEGGIGGAMNTVSYNSTPILPVDSPNFTLSSQDSWRFAYQAGAGLKYALKPNTWLSLRYLYANMGKANSSVLGSSDVLATPLIIDMSTQNVLLGLTYSLE